MLTSGGFVAYCSFLPPCVCQKVRDQPQRASRLLLDIEAGAPVILIPESSWSPRLIVVNLGQLRVKNHFLPAGAYGTFSLRDKVEKLTMAHVFFPSLVSHASGFIHAWSDACAPFLFQSFLISPHLLLFKLYV